MNLLSGKSHKYIKQKIESWIWYEENRPKFSYKENPKAHDEFRSKNDLDCVLANGNLNADTIFSLWVPLRITLVRLNGYAKLNRVGNINDKYSFLKSINDKNKLEELLPKNNETVRLLERLFEVGQTRANIMILPNNNRWMNSERGQKPYYDYTPYFLYDCFSGGEFSSGFESDEELKEWIKKESLEGFFDGYITKENIKDLSRSGDIKKGIPKDIKVLLESYIKILENRK